MDPSLWPLERSYAGQLIATEAGTPVKIHIIVVEADGCWCYTAADGKTVRLSIESVGRL